jgi:hypothetical protein
MRALPRRGRSWGVARKLLNIFLRDALYTSYLAETCGLRRSERWLEVPLDSITAKRILDASRTGELPAWPGVRRLTPRTSELFQAAAARLAGPYGVSSVHMDTFWWGAREGAGPPRLALSVRQPFAEWIVQGRKTIEVRSRPTRVRERVYIYASRSGAAVARAELAPTGCVVGTVRIIGCRRLLRADSRAAGFKITGTRDQYAWLLAEPKQLKKPFVPKGHPNPVWFEP